MAQGANHRPPSNDFDFIKKKTIENVKKPQQPQQYDLYALGQPKSGSCLLKSNLDNYKYCKFGLKNWKH